MDKMKNMGISAILPCDLKHRSNNPVTYLPGDFAIQFTEIPNQIIALVYISVSFLSFFSLFSQISLCMKCNLKL